MTLRAGFDVDGVLANFGRAIRALATQGAKWRGQRPGGLTAADMKRAWALIETTPQWWLQLEPYEPGQIARLYDVSRTRRWEVYFLTTRPASAGETPQFQTQWWLERQGFSLPSVLTVPGSRGELANALRLDVVVDDQLVNCTDIIAASRAKAILLQRRPDPAARDQALSHGIGVVGTLAEALDAVEHFEAVKARSPRATRLADWFKPAAEPAAGLPRDARGELGAVRAPFHRS